MKDIPRMPIKEVGSYIVDMMLMFVSGIILTMAAFIVVLCLMIGARG